MHKQLFRYNKDMLIHEWKTWIVKQSELHSRFSVTIKNYNFIEKHETFNRFTCMSFVTCT